jgi:hypothetical protein
MSVSLAYAVACRLLLQTCCLSVGYVVVVAVALWWPLILLVVVAFLAFAVRRPSLPGSGAMGTASWATPEELSRKGLLGQSGLLLGRVRANHPRLALGLLFRLPWQQSDLAVRLFLSAYRNGD